VNTLLGSLMGTGEVTGEQLQREVADVGGIPFQRHVPIAFMGRAELVEYLREVLDSDYPPAQADADERLLQALDLLGPEVDLRTLRARVLQDNVVGFYDERPGRQQLFAVSEEEAFTPMNQIVLVHELRHALQDQYEPLHWQLPEEVGDFDDRRLAWMSLLEGDATLVMERFVLGRLGALGLGLPGGLADQSYSDMAVPGLADVPGAPPVIRDQLVMPYLVGRDLARAIEARGGAEAMREAWRRPPSSTEQVLHPDKFFNGEPPLVVTPRRAPPGGRLLSQGVVGELLIRTLVEEANERLGRRERRRRVRGRPLPEVRPAAGKRRPTGLVGGVRRRGGLALRRASRRRRGRPRVGRCARGVRGTAELTIPAAWDHDSARASRGRSGRPHAGTLASGVGLFRRKLRPRSLDSPARAHGHIAQ
jgi:hypothetical protein